MPITSVLQENTSMKRKCDVLIIGAGPSGLFTALCLSKKGHHTIIIEKNNKIGITKTKYDITEGNRIESILSEVKIRPNKISYTFQSPKIVEFSVPLPIVNNR